MARKVYRTVNRHTLYLPRHGTAVYIHLVIRLQDKPFTIINDKTVFDGI